MAEQGLGFNSLKITDQEFNRIRTLVYDRFGINLTDAKRGLVVGRLQKVLREKGLSDFSSYLDFLEKDSSNALSELINRISTNHTYFYREKDHFEYLVAEVLPALTAKIEATRNLDLRIWCAGCSSGEEPYTIIMLLKEFFGPHYSQWKAGILATDISANVLQTAIRGVYHQDRINHLPPALKNKYFKKVDSEQYEVIDSIKREVTFRRFNLMNKQFPFKKQFHIIFCRNVMIYFDQETRTSLVQRYCNSTEPEGYLFIGHSESLGRNSSIYKYIKPAVYQKV